MNNTEKDPEIRLYKFLQSILDKGVYNVLNEIRLKAIFIFNKRFGVKDEYFNDYLTDTMLHVLAQKNEYKENWNRLTDSERTEYMLWIMQTI